MTDEDAVREIWKNNETCKLQRQIQRKNDKQSTTKGKGTRIKAALANYLKTSKQRQAQLEERKLIINVLVKMKLDLQ